MGDIKYEKYIGEEGIFWDKLHNGEREEILKIIKKFEENE